MSVDLVYNRDYAQVMKNKTGFIFLATLLIAFNGMVNAGFYKSVDENGNIVYSDTPTPGAEQLKPPPISTVPARTPPKPEASEADKAADTEQSEKKPPTRYSKFSIVTPKNDDTIWDNNGSVPVTLQLEPALDTENGHTVWVYVDGFAEVKRSQSLNQPLSGIDRGTHKIRAEIRDTQRKTLKRTKTITVHLKRASALRPAGGP
jgi:hypothetical protein